MRLKKSSSLLKKYSHDQGMYTITPDYVAFPKNEEDLIELTEFATKHHVALHARGGGTGLSGAALGKGIIIDFSKGMKKILSVGKKTRVQAGVLLKNLRPKLHGVMITGVPLHGWCAIGGNVNTRSVGPRSVQYGSIDARVKSVRGVLADGRVLDTSKNIPPDIAQNVLDRTCWY